MPEPPLGDYLGDFKDELPPDDYIVEFASGGPKRYKTHKGKDDFTKNTSWSTTSAW